MTEIVITSILLAALLLLGDPPAPEFFAGAVIFLLSGVHVLLACFRGEAPDFYPDDPQLKKGGALRPVIGIAGVSMLVTGALLWFKS